MLVKIAAITRGFVQQFLGILRYEPEMGTPISTPAGRVIVRIKFHIWPGRSGPIENDYKQEIVQSLKELDSAYADWMVSINEVSEAPAAIRPFRVPRATLRAEEKRNTTNNSR
jgi:hypothetical protein